MLLPEELRLASEGLLAKISHQAKGRGTVLVITSPHRGAGVSTIAKAFVETIGEGDQQAILTDYRSPRISSKDRNGASGGRASIKRNLWQLAEDHSEFDRLSPRHINLANAIATLRRQYQYVVIDCPSIHESNDAVSLAQLVDGFVLVVEANKTQGAQIAYAERAIETSGGHIFGVVLNKRSFAIPHWLYRKMQALGI